MNFSKSANDFLLSSLSRRHTDQIALWATENEVNFEELYRFIFSEDTKTAWRAAWTVEKVCELQPELLTGNCPKLLLHCQISGTTARNAAFCSSSYTRHCPSLFLCN